MVKAKWSDGCEFVVDDLADLAFVSVATKNVETILPGQRTRVYDLSIRIMGEAADFIPTTGWVNEKSFLWIRDKFQWI